MRTGSTVSRLVRPGLRFGPRFGLFNSPLAHRANVCGRTIVISSLIALPSGLQYRTSR